MPVSPYTPVGWVDDSAPPTSAANFNHMDNQIDALTDDVIALNAGVAIPRYSVAAFQALSGPFADGKEVEVEADAANGILWRFRYNNNGGSPGTYPWEFIGGPDLYAEVTTDQTTASASYTDLATAGPSITAPLPGDYSIEFGASGNHGSTTTNGMCAVKIGAAATADAEGIYWGTSSVWSSVARRIRRTLASAGTVLKLQYKTTNASHTTHAQNRYISVRPVRVSQ